MGEIQEKLLKYGLTEEKYEEIIQEIEDTKDRGITVNWDELILKHNVSIHRDTVRKGSDSIFGSYFVKKYFDNKNTKNVITEDEVMDKYEAKIKELRTERKKIQAVNIERNRHDRQDDRFELYYETLSDNIEKYPIPEFNEIKLQDGRKDYLLTIADIHAGAKFKSQNNTYDFAECERRFEVLLNRSIQYVNKNNVSKLKVLELGDSIQGLLRISDIKLNETTVIDAVIRVSRLLASFVNQLSKYCEIEYMHVMSSNHSQTRPLGTKANEMASEDLEKFIVNYIHDVLIENERVIVHNELDSDRLMFDILGFNCIALHGQQIKNIKGSIKDLSLLHRKFFDFVILAHYHAGTMYMNGESDIQSEIIVAPSFVGSDPYSDSLMVGAKAMCQIHEFEEYEGRVSTTNIKLN